MTGTPWFFCCAGLLAAQAPAGAVAPQSFARLFMAMGFVGIVMVLVVVVMVVMAVRRFWELRLAFLAPESLQKSLERAIHARDLERALHDASASRSLLGEVVAGGLHLRGVGLDEMLGNVERVTTKAAMAIGNRVANLARWGGASVLVGLLGTTLGVISALLRIAQFKNPTVTDFVVGILEALTCTAFGLFGALFCFGAFFWFDYRLTQRVIAVREMAEEMMRLASEQVRPR